MLPSLLNLHFSLSDFEPRLGEDSGQHRSRHLIRLERGMSVYEIEGKESAFTPDVTST